MRNVQNGVGYPCSKGFVFVVRRYPTHSMPKLLHLQVACAENRVIGRAGRLPWRIPEDLKFFHDQTAGQIVVLGRICFQTWPRVLLDGRRPVVITRNIQLANDQVHVAASLAGACPRRLRRTLPPGEPYLRRRSASTRKPSRSSARCGCTLRSSMRRCPVTPIFPSGATSPGARPAGATAPTPTTATRFLHAETVGRPSAANHQAPTSSSKNRFLGAGGWGFALLLLHEPLRSRRTSPPTGCRMKAISSGRQRPDDFHAGEPYTIEPGGHSECLRHERIRAPTMLLRADLRSIEDRRAHADEAFVTDRAGMDDGRTADRAPFADVGAIVIGEMHNGVVLGCWSPRPPGSRGCHRAAPRRKTHWSAGRGRRRH